MEVTIAKCACGLLWTMCPGSWVPISHVSHLISISFRFQISASVLLLTASTHALCYPHVPKSSRRNSDTNLNLSPEKIHSQPTVTSISGFDCTSAFETPDFRQRPSFQFQNSISGFRLSQREKLKSRLRFQVSGFRLSQGEKLKPRLRFQFQASISCDFRRVS